MSYHTHDARAVRSWVTAVHQLTRGLDVLAGAPNLDCSFCSDSYRLIAAGSPFLGIYGERGAQH